METGQTGAPPASSATAARPGRGRGLAEAGHQAGEGHVGLAALPLDLQLGLQQVGGEAGQERLRQPAGGEVGAVEPEGVEAGQRVLPAGGDLGLQRRRVLVLKRA